MATETPETEPAEDAPRLPEKIGPADLEALNEALAALFGGLRDARSLPLLGTHGRLGAIAALRTVWWFLTCFEPVIAETLHVPLLNLHGALLALNDNNVGPLLKPTPKPAGGRARSSPAQEELIGFAAGAVGRLRWTGMRIRAAHMAVADTLDKLGLRPGRGAGPITARTVREWCERVAADVAGDTIAAQEAELMLTAKWESAIKAQSPTEARKFVLRALAHTASVLIMGTANAGRKAT